MQTATILPGFTDPVHDAARTFRGILEAMAHPGRVVRPLRTILPGTPPTGLHAVTAAVALTLFDHETPVHGSSLSDEAEAWFRFHCGCPVVADTAPARFVVMGDGMALPDLTHIETGTDTYPDRSATLLIQVASLVTAVGGEDAAALSGMDLIRLEGPGIPGERRLLVAGLDKGFWQAFARNRSLYPAGYDVMLLAPEALACLPRTVTARGPLTCM